MMFNQVKNPIKKLLIATGNKGKLVEIAKLLKTIDIEAIGSFDYNFSEPEENGKNFIDNSIIKARHYGDKAGLVTLSDDSGLCIDLLGGEPGIYSARWAINDKTGQKDFATAFEKIKEKLIDSGVDLNKTKVKAHFICNLSTYNPKTKITNSFEGRVGGQIIYPARGINGFGYDPIFIPEGYDKTFGEMDPKLKDSISHRSKAFQKFVEWYMNR